ncbi:hypothetical protein [Sphingobium sp. TCM1]|nr:hypothetical protein [Sphingobium sp. TCM1]
MRYQDNTARTGKSLYSEATDGIFRAASQASKAADYLLASLGEEGKDHD